MSSDACRHMHVNGRACEGRLSAAERGAGYRYCLAHREQGERDACTTCRTMLDGFTPDRGWTRDDYALMRRGSGRPS